MTISKYKRAKVLFILRRRFIPWVGHQVARLFVALCLVLVLDAVAWPCFIQWAWDRVYTNCVSTATYFSCEVRHAN